MAVEITRVLRSSKHVLDTVAEDVFDGPIIEGWLEAFLASPDALMLVAVEDGLVIGQLAASVNRNPCLPPALHIDNLGVAPDRQREGIGGRLVRQAVAFARRTGCESVWVAADGEDVDAQAFYEAVGFSGRTSVMFENDV